MTDYILQQAERERKFFDNKYESFKVYRVPPLDMHDFYPRLFPKSLTGKKVCIVASIVDWYPIAFARMGAAVTGFDISSIAVDFGYSLAEFNGVSSVRYDQKNIYDLDYLDSSFDILYGASVLHHFADIESAGKQLHRILRLGGVGVFDENSLRNPLLRVTRSFLFPPSQKGGKVQIGRFGFSRHGTEDENPLTEDEVRILKNIFGNLDRYYPNYCFFRLLSDYGPHWVRTDRFKQVFGLCDSFIGQRMPYLHWTSFLQTLVFHKSL